MNNAVVYCDICATSICGDDNWRKHLVGKQHLTKAARTLRSSEDRPGTPTKDIGGNYFCTVCNVPTTGFEPYQEHCRGAKHLKNVALKGSSVAVKLQSNPPLAHAVQSSPRSSSPFTCTPAYSSMLSPYSSPQKHTNDECIKEYSKNIIIIRHDQKIESLLPNVL